MRATAILFTAPDEVACGTVEIPEPHEDELLIEAMYTCISPGTELRTLAGKQAGTRGWPLIPGYSMVGRVVRGGAGARYEPGTIVFCKGTARADTHLVWGAHVSHAVVPSDRAIPVPSGVDPLEAATAKLAAIAYRGMTIVHPLPHESVAIVGLGIIGQLAARLHALTGAHVLAADPSLARVAAAERGGVVAFVPTGGLVTAFRERLPAGADIVVDATGSPAATADAVELAKDVPWGDPPGRSARFLVQGSYAGDVSFPYQAAFRKELAIYLTRDEGPRDITTVLDLMQRGRLVTRDLIGRVEAPDQAPAIYQMLQRQGDLLTAVFRWR